MKKFWARKLNEAFESRELGSKKISDWQILNLIILKYDLNISLRGFGATEGAIKIVKDIKGWEQLDVREKVFVGDLAGGPSK